MSKYFLISVLLSIGSLLSCQTSTPHWIQSLDYDTEEIYPIEIGSYGYPSVPIKLNGKELTLPWDTGNMGRLAITKEVADKLELPVIDKTNSYDSEGNLVRSRSVFRVDSLMLFNQTWKGFQAVELDHPNLEGLIGPYFAHGKRFTLDYKNKLIAITDKPLRKSHPGEEFVLVRSPIHELLIIIYTEVNGHRVLTEIDTGKSRSVIDPRLAKKLGFPQLKNGFRIDKLKIGSNVFTVPSAKAVKFEGISEGLPEKIQLGIGSDILSELLLTVDYNENKVLLQSN